MANLFKAVIQGGPHPKAFEKKKTAYVLQKSLSEILVPVKKLSDRIKIFSIALPAFAKAESAPFVQA